jgi:hypothetical protein
LRKAPFFSPKIGKNRRKLSSQHRPLVSLLKKIAQNVAQAIICQNQYITFAVKKSSRKMCATSLILKNLPNQTIIPKEKIRLIWSPCHCAPFFVAH